MKREIIRTGDGSTTIQIVELGEQYHSIHGAIREAEHVFISNFLNLRSSNELNIFEMGFGTGLNALLTCLAAHTHQLQVHYTTLEAFPVQDNEIAQLNFSELIKGCENTLNNLHRAEWEIPVVLGEHFILEKKQVAIQECEFEPEKFDFIFYDAFGPRVQPELWTPEIFSSLFDTLKKGGIFLTYCAKGQVRRDLQEVGFLVTKLPGPPGKREMLMARK